MGIDEIAQEIKNMPGFADKVGMILLHNGVARGFSRNVEKTVSKLEVKVDQKLVDEYCAECRKRAGIFAVKVVALEGEFKPGEDVLYLAIAGDIRENVIAAFEDLLFKVKKYAIIKKEFTL